MFGFVYTSLDLSPQVLTPLRGLDGPGLLGLLGLGVVPQPLCSFLLRPTGAQTPNPQRLAAMLLAASAAGVGRKN